MAVRGRFYSSHSVSHGRDARATIASWHGRPGHDTKLDRFVNVVLIKWTVVADWGSAAM